MLLRSSLTCRSSSVTSSLDTREMSSTILCCIALHVLFNSLKKRKQTMQRRIIQLVNDAPILPLVAFGSSFKQVNKKIWMRNLQKLMIGWILLTGNHLCQHLRHHLSVPTHNVELTAQLANLINYIWLNHYAIYENKCWLSHLKEWRKKVL